MAGLTSRQQTEFAALRGALNDGDLEMVAASFELLQSLETPLLPLLDALGQGIWDDDDDIGGVESMLEIMLASLSASSIPALATYLMEEEGPDILLDMIAERLEEFDTDLTVKALERGLRDPDERIREGARDYLDELLADEDSDLVVEDDDFDDDF